MPNRSAKVIGLLFLYRSAIPGNMGLLEDYGWTACDIWQEWR